MATALSTTAYDQLYRCWFPAGNGVEEEGYLSAIGRSLVTIGIAALVAPVGVLWRIGEMGCFFVTPLFQENAEASYNWKKLDELAHALFIDLGVAVMGGLVVLNNFLIVTDISTDSLLWGLMHLVGLVAANLLTIWLAIDASLLPEALREFEPHFDNAFRSSTDTPPFFEYLSHSRSPLHLWNTSRLETVRTVLANDTGEGLTPTYIQLRSRIRNSTSPIGVLGLQEGCSRSALKKAYYNLALCAHPDKQQKYSKRK